MSTYQAETRATEEPQDDEFDEQLLDKIPSEKSGVRVDPDAALQTARFFKGDHVHMSQIMNGQRIKGTFVIDQSQYNTGGGFVEYRLREPVTESLYKNGAWFREKNLKANSSGRG